MFPAGGSGCTQRPWVVCGRGEGVHVAAGAAAAGCRYVDPVRALQPYSWSEAAGRVLLEQLHGGAFLPDGFIGCVRLAPRNAFIVATCRRAARRPPAAARTPVASYWTCLLSSCTTCICVLDIKSTYQCSVSVQLQSSSGVRRERNAIMYSCRVGTARRHLLHVTSNDGQRRPVLHWACAAEDLVWTARIGPLDVALLALAPPPLAVGRASGAASSPQLPFSAGRLRGGARDRWSPLTPSASLYQAGAWKRSCFR